MKEVLSNNNLELKVYFQSDKDKDLNKVRFKQLQPTKRIMSPVSIGSRRISMVSSMKSIQINQMPSSMSTHQIISKLKRPSTNLKYRQKIEEAYSWKNKNSMNSLFPSYFWKEASESSKALGQMTHRPKTKQIERNMNRNLLVYSSIPCRSEESIK